MKRLLIILMCVMAALPMSGRKKVALVLGGGGAKGAAEVGVLKYIERSGVPIDMVVGTSIGSVVGGLYCMGYSADEMDRLFRSQEWIDLFTDGVSVESLLNEVAESPKSALQKITGLLDFKSMFKDYGIVKGDSIVGFLNKMVSARGACMQSSFDSLRVPFRAVAVDLKAMDEVVIRQGDLPMTMRASMAIPLVFRPVQKDGMLLADGGVLNNLPVDVARNMGADIVIAVDLTQNKHDDSQVGSELLNKSYVIKLLERVPWVNWLLKRPDREKYNQNVKDADVYINPRLDDCSVTSFAKVDYMIGQGEKAGKAALKKLKKVKKKAKKG
ncbi:MAG: patatin-like phospholipase family protein [Bacteroidaceae bacterium]|nr:patatin-like phospholipase family protein [Bacteroidaceae bacterium]